MIFKYKNNILENGSLPRIFKPRKMLLESNFNNLLRKVLQMRSQKNENSVFAVQIHYRTQTLGLFQYQGAPWYLTQTILSGLKNLQNLHPKILELSQMVKLNYQNYFAQLINKVHIKKSLHNQEELNIYLLNDYMYQK